jgi:hypothetical protein
MKNRHPFLCLSFVLYCCACTEEYNLNISETSKILVVDGLITSNPGPYFVRLTWSAPGITKTSLSTSERYTDDGAIPVKDALITLCDNVGNIDTLKLVPDTTYLFYKYLNDLTNDTLTTKYQLDCTGSIGFYQTSNIQGVVGRTYTLTIVENGKTYTAESYMYSLPVFDSLSYEKKILEKDGSSYYVPLLYFKKLEGQINYYLFQFNSGIIDNRLPNQTILPIVSINEKKWNFSIISDELLDSYVNGLNIQEGVSPYYNNTNWESSNLYLTISSLPQEAYLFYSNLILQLTYNGNAYNQMPASPPSNINNGALGLFRASAIAELRKKITE